MDELILRLDISGNIAKASACCGGQIKSVFQELPKREWVGLTDGEIPTLYFERTLIPFADTKTFVQAIEAKLKEKNNV